MSGSPMLQSQTLPAQIEQEEVPFDEPSFLGLFCVDGADNLALNYCVWAPCLGNVEGLT